MIKFLINYFKEVRQELEKVTWPSREQTIQKTLLVIVSSIVIGFFVGGLDILFTELTKLLIK